MCFITHCALAFNAGALEQSWQCTWIYWASWQEFSLGDVSDIHNVAVFAGKKQKQRGSKNNSSQPRWSVRGSERHKRTRTHTRGSDAAPPNIGRNYISHNSYSCIHKHQKQTRICGQTQMHKYGHRHSGTRGHKTSRRHADHCSTENSQGQKSEPAVHVHSGMLANYEKNGRTSHKHTQTWTHTHIYTTDRREYKLRERWGVVWCCQAAGHVHIVTRCICVHLI